MRPPNERTAGDVRAYLLAVESAEGPLRLIRASLA